VVDVFFFTYLCKTTCCMLQSKSYSVGSVGHLVEISYSISFFFWEYCLRHDENAAD
jgi:hypothetical protein